MVLVGAYGAAIFGGANTVNVLTGSGAVEVVGGTGTANIYEMGSGAVVALGTAGGTITIHGSSASSTFAEAASGAETLNLSSAGAADVVGGSGTDTVSLGSGDSYFLAGSGAATVTGGSAPDAYVFFSGNAGGVDTITNFKSSDQIDVGGYTNAWAYIQGHEKVSGGNLTFSLPDGTRVTLDGVTSLAPSQFFDLSAAQVNLAGLTGGDAVEGTPIVATASGLGGFGAITYNFTVGSTLLQSGASSSYTPGYGGPAGETITVTASRAGFSTAASAGPLQAVDAPGTLTLSGLTSGNAYEGTPIVATIADPNGAPATATYTFKSGTTTLQTGASNSYTPGYASSGEAITASAAYVDGQGFSDAASASAGTVQDVDQPGTLTLSGLTGGDASVGTPIVVTISDPDGAPTSATYSFTDGSLLLQTGSSDSYEPTQSQPNEVIDISANYVDGQGHHDMAYASADVACYARGTRILTEDGETAVENLAIGDTLITASGAHRPIKWIGHRKLNCRNHPRPDKALPVRIAAHAFGENRPSRDLYLSPEHAICVSVPHEVLMPVHALINGSTVQQIEVDEVTYWHVELESHDIILAENMPAESYYEWDNRQFFVESALVELNATPDAPAPSFDDYCRPFHKKGELVENVRAAMKDRADVLQLSIASRAA